MTLPSIIAVAGGSCSGKTTIVKHFKNHFNGISCTVIEQDNYYFNKGGAKTVEEANFDAPSAIDFKLLSDHLALLKSGSSIKMPDYNFIEHMRTNQTYSISPASIILVDGILLLNDPNIRKIVDYKIFVECAEDTRLERRLKRDIESRGRTEQSVLQQFSNQVAPMHNKYVAPSKIHADLILTVDDCNNILEGNDTNCLSPLYKKLSTAMPHKAVRQYTP